MKQTANKKKAWIGVLALVVVAAILVAVYLIAGKKPQEGGKSCTVEVQDNKGKVKEYPISTDAKYLREVMDELSEGGDFSYSGEEGTYGLYIETVNGLTADYEEDGAYWSIYVNGEYGQNSADRQPVEDGDVYRLAYETENE